MPVSFHINKTKMILLLEAKLTLKDQNGNTPLHYSIIGHRDDMLSTLIQNRVDPGIINQGSFLVECFSNL